MIALSNAMYINLGLQINDKAEKICILGNTIGFFGAVVNNKLSLSDSNPDTISNNLCWLINECRKNSEIMIIGNADIYKYYKIIFKWIGDSLQKRINWSSVNITKIIKNLSDFEEFEDNVDKSYIKVLEELYNKKLKFTKIIMNPPYDGNFHLKLVSTAMRLSDDIINLSPIRWLQDPLAEYKKNSDWNKFEDIRTHIESLNEIKAEDAQDMFESGQYENLGIYHINDKGGATIIPKPFISQVLFDKVNLPTYQGKYKSLYDVKGYEGKPDFSKPFVRLTPLHGHVNCSDWNDIISPQRDLALTDKGNNTSGTFTINFDTVEEAENFFNYCNTDFVKACNGNVKTNIRWPGYAIPFMPTYSHPWTDEMLYDFFGLTPEERDEIDNI